MQTHKIFFLIGASGSGKTVAAEKLETQLPDLRVCYSDRSGVPSPEEMVKQYGSGEEWQRHNTIEWVKKIKSDYLEHQNAILDTQSRPTFIKEACEINGVTDYSIILVDCSDDIRKKRLEGRGQPELASDRMMNWAKYLREQSQGQVILDNSDLTIDETVEALIRLMQ